MSKIDKLYNKLKNPSYKQKINKDDIIPLLNHYFPYQYQYEGTRGSHVYKIEAPELIDHPNCIEGIYSIPVSGGKKIKPVYVKQLIKIIEYVELKRSEKNG